MLKFGKKIYINNKKSDYKFDGTEIAYKTQNPETRPAKT